MRSRNVVQDLHGLPSLSRITPGGVFCLGGCSIESAWKGRSSDIPAECWLRDVLDKNQKFRNSKIVVIPNLFRSMEDWFVLLAHQPALQGSPKRVR